jgi:ATP-dependent DNA helicase RecG
MINRQKKVEIGFDSLACFDSSIEELDIVLFKLKYLPKAMNEDILKANNQEDKQKLASLRLCDLDNDCATYGGILLLHNNPIYYLPGAYIQYVKFQDVTRTGDVLAEKIFKGHLIDVLKNIDDFIKYNIIVEKPVRNGTFREDTYRSYPAWALRELTLNAIMHRDYQSNAPIYIYEFKDRIEIHNPGGLYGGVRPNNFPNTSDYRNPVLAEILRNLGYVNRFNYGIQRSQEEFAQNGNPPAIFDISVQTHFAVSVFKKSEP